MGRALYAALAAGDQESLRQLLADDFVGDLTPGLPNHFGERPYEGREAMMRDGWGAVGQEFAMSPQVDEILLSADYIIGRGHHVGEATSTGKPVRARFRSLLAGQRRQDRLCVSGHRQRNLGTCASARLKLTHYPLRGHLDVSHQEGVGRPPRSSDSRPSCGNGRDLFRERQEQR